MELKKGFYFSLDAMLGAILIVGGLVLVSQMVSEDVTSQNMDYMSKDLLTSMTELRVEEVNHSMINEMVKDGRIENANNTLLEQLGEFWALNETENAENFSRAVMEELVPKKFSAEIGIEQDYIFKVNQTASREDVVTATRMVTGIKKGKAIRGSTAAAHLERVSNKRTNHFLYFGGFVGQGNLTGVVEDIPDDVNASEDVEEVLLEADISDEFEVLINNDSCGSFTPTSGNMTPEVWNLTGCRSSLKTGRNEVELVFPTGISGAAVSGGFFKVKYQTEDPQSDVLNGSKKYKFPGVNGVINLYDSIYAPGDINEMEVHLHYEVDQDTSLPIFLDIGNTTVYEENSTGELTHTISNNTLASMLNYSFLSKTTVPIRLGFYHGNSTANSGNISDVFLSTSRAGTMSEADINGTNKTRMEVAKNLSHGFVDIVLNKTGNRMGLASYFASSHIDDQLTNDSEQLHNTISDYDVQNPDNAERYLCENINDAKDELEAAPNSRDKSLVLMTDGNATKCCSSGKCTLEKARQDAIDAACDDYNVTDITVHTIGFGRGADDELLNEIANCTEGLFRKSNNFTGLQDIYEEFANTVAESSIVYTFQRATQADNVESELFTDSYIKMGYDPDVPQPGANEISVVIQKDQFGGCSPTVNIQPELRVLDARVTSYSGDHWTKLLKANGNVAYNLSQFGENYTTLGDPYTVNVPAPFLTGGSNDLFIQTGDSPNTSTGCSVNNSMVYTAAVNLSTGRSSVVEEADGCNWQVEFESGNMQNFSVPADYTGNNTCSYTSSSISYDDNDAYDVSVHEMLEKLDFDDDGRVFVDFTEQDLEITADIIRQVPYLWGPALAEVNVWR